MMRMWKMRAVGTMRSNRLKYFEQVECDIVVDSNVKQ
jgi:hypothetical protein